MELSTRNRFKGTIKKVELGAVNAEITIEIAPGLEVVSVITKSSAERLKLTEGKARSLPARSRFSLSLLSPILLQNHLGLLYLWQNCTHSYQ